MTKIPYDPFKDGEQLPKAGLVLAPLFTWRGMDVYPIFGAEGDDADVDSPDSDSDEDSSAEGAREGKPDGDADKVTREEFDRLRKHLSESDKKKSAAEKRLKEIEDANKDELTKATEKVTELEKVAAEQLKELAEMRLQNAFLTADTGVTWHDPEDALDIAQRRGYLTEVVGEDGKVDVAKLSAKLKELAKAKPNLVKSDGKKDEDPKPRKTGEQVGSKGSTGGTTGDKIPDRYNKFLNR